MKLRLDPWAAEYNTAFHADTSAHTEKTNVNASFEVAQADWHAIKPPESHILWDDLLFLDGSRRIEARVLLENEQAEVAFGALGTYGVGVVSCCANLSRRATFIDLHAHGMQNVNRICVLSSGHSLPDFKLLPNMRSQLGQLEYRVVSSSERDADAVIRRLQVEMLNAEQLLASRLVEAFPNALIICDGPRPFGLKETNVIGYIKTIHDVKVGKSQLELIRQLEEGERSPIYLIETDDKQRQYFEWFLRLRDPRPWLYSLAGMVRLQAYAGANPEETFETAQIIADWSCLNLRAFASRQHQDPRAPQQLLPIRALENELGRRMGHPQVVRRRITQFLAQGEH